MHRTRAAQFSCCTRAALVLFLHASNSCCTLQVRHPSGLLDIAGDLDYYGEEIPGDPEGVWCMPLMHAHSREISLQLQL